MPSLRAAALTDIGRVRRKNEDRYLLSPEDMLFGVADGVGGLPNGAEAAQQAIDEVAAAVHLWPQDSEPDLTSIVLHANEAVAQLGLLVSPAVGIGTTLTFGCVRKDTLRIAHVGDSRSYVWFNGEFARITEDHSVENEARLRRAKGDFVYYHEANRNALTRCIGQPTPPEVDLIDRPLVVGERYLFCTDGVTRMLRDAELGELMASPAEPEDILREMITLAVRRGGPDNATAVLVFVDEV
ncbi:MAG TPA: protein phosphatase 2C domain-containing protein [Opitutaceae bacterium]|nr:protein phosphatase 2C domain-containing protein [Opitutaceae bacterium]